MDAASELDRRVTHVEDETVHIYDLIEERSAEFRHRFDGVDHRLDAVEQTLAEHSLALAEILRRLPDSR